MLFLNEYSHRYLRLKHIIFSTLIIAILRELICYYHTLNAWKSLEISYNSIKYNLLTIFTSNILIFEPILMNINVISGECEQFHEIEFRTSKTTINNCIFIILCIKHITYLLLSDFYSEKIFFCDMFVFIINLYDLFFLFFC